MHPTLISFMVMGQRDDAIDNNIKTAKEPLFYELQV